MQRVTVTSGPEDPAETARWEAEKRADRMEPPMTDNGWLKTEPINARPTGWLRHADPETQHTCTPPMHEWVFKVPKAFVAPDRVDDPPVHREQRPDGQAGDVWRCTCGRLWMIVMVGGSIGGYYVIPRAEWQQTGPLPRLLCRLGMWP